MARGSAVMRRVAAAGGAGGRGAVRGGDRSPTFFVWVGGGAEQTEVDDAWGLVGPLQTVVWLGRLFVGT
jgi:hypothetical protein